MTITRRAVVGMILGIAAGGLARLRSGVITGSDGSRTRKPLVLTECFVAGFRFHDGPTIMPRLEPGKELQLMAEQNNPHDQWAVRIQCAGHHIGYLPRTQNQTVSRLLQQGAQLRCRIVAVDPMAAPWESVKVQSELLT